MAAAPVAGGIGQGDSSGAAGIIGRKLQALHVDGEILRAFYFLRERLGALGPELARALCLAHQVHGLDHGLIVAEIQIQTAQLFPAEQAALLAFHQKADGVAGGDGIKPVFIAEPLGLYDGLHFGVAALGPKGPGGLILRPLGIRPFVGGPSSTSAILLQRMGQPKQARWRFQ